MLYRCCRRRRRILYFPSRQFAHPNHTTFALYLKRQINDEEQNHQPAITRHTHGEKHMLTRLYLQYSGEMRSTLNALNSLCIYVLTLAKFSSYFQNTMYELHAFKCVGKSCETVFQCPAASDSLSKRIQTQSRSHDFKSVKLHNLNSVICFDCKLLCSLVSSFRLFYIFCFLFQRKYVP